MNKDNPSLKKGLIKWAFRGVMYKAYVAVVLMLSAGRWNWWAGWLYVFIFLMFDLATALEHFTAEIGNIRIAAIDNGRGRYDIPVDLTIDQYNPASWNDTIDNIIARAKESSNPTVVLMQHEYGLDPDDDGRGGRGTNFIKMARAFKANGLITLVYLHTVLDNPDEHQKKVLQDLAESSDGLRPPAYSGSVAVSATLQLSSFGAPRIDSLPAPERSK